MSRTLPVEHGTDILSNLTMVNCSKNPPRMAAKPRHGHLAGLSLAFDIGAAKDCFSYAFSRKLAVVLYAYKEYLGECSLTDNSGTKICLHCNQ